jgi:hypothetical protein
MPEKKCARSSMIPAVMYFLKHVSEFRKAPPAFSDNASQDEVDEQQLRVECEAEVRRFRAERPLRFLTPLFG